MTSHVVEFQSDGQRFNFYCDACSIADAEAQAAKWGIIGEGFEVVECVEGHLNR